MDHNHLLWDDTVAGPKPDRNIIIPGAGRINKKNMFRPSLSLILDPVDVVVPVITRSITILKPNSSSSSATAAATTTTTSDLDSLIISSSVPSSPAAGSCSSPSSPFSPRTPQFDSKGLLTRRKPKPPTMTTMEKKSSVVYEPRTPTVYDWVVISALDR